MIRKLIEWIKSCFAGSIAVNEKDRGKINVDIIVLTMMKRVDCTSKLLKVLRYGE